MCVCVWQKETGRVRQRSKEWQREGEVENERGEKARERENKLEIPSTPLTIGNRVETVTTKTKATRSVSLN